MKSLTDFYGIDKVSSIRSYLQQPSSTAAEIVANYGGLSIGGGVYRIATDAMARRLQDSLLMGFSDVKGPYSTFAYDWLGRVFAHRPAMGSNGECILMFEVGAAEVMNIPVGIRDFHANELIGSRNDALAYGFFTEWREKNPQISINLSDCVGFKKPLFLGGRDVIDNLELCDLDVYVSMNAQLRAKIRKGSA